MIDMAQTDTYGWVVCAPGDPTPAQLERMIAMSGEHSYTATQYNERLGHVRFVVWDADERRYQVSPDGSRALYLGRGAAGIMRGKGEGI